MEVVAICQKKKKKVKLLEYAYSEQACELSIGGKLQILKS